MHTGFSNNPALIVAIALAAGVAAQALARHLRMPGIVLLLAAGVALGPDGAGIIEPSVLGTALEALIGFAVAVILFEGGLNLNLKRIRAEATTIRLLLTLGVVVTAGGGALAARLAMGWDWTPSLLFGTLVIVTGPTVVTPLLRRIKVRRKLETILETEGVLIDAVGAVLAVVALEIALAPESSAMAQAQGAAGAPARLLVGLLAGLVGGGLMAWPLRHRHVIPEGFENIFTLAFTLALYQISNAILPETGIMAAITAGAVVGNVRGHGDRELKAFKEQLTALLIGMLFVLLAADVRLREVAALGGPGLLTVAALMFVVRPVEILLCTPRTGLTWREKIFLSWVAPRGIVAAAVASLFAHRLAEAGWEGGEQMRALVFLVIASTVIFQGATASLMARALGVRRPSNLGYAILGAQPFGRLLGRLLRNGGHDVVLLDANANHCRDAEAEGLHVIYGNAMEDGVRRRARLDSRRGAIGALHNEAVNLRFAREARRVGKVPRAYALCQRGNSAVEPQDLEAVDVSLLCGMETDPELWSVRIRRGTALIERWRQTSGDDRSFDMAGGSSSVLLPLPTTKVGELPTPVDEASIAHEGDEALWLIFKERREEAVAWLSEHGWESQGVLVPESG